MARDSVPCIFCGGETRAETVNDKERYRTERRRCLVCMMAFERSQGKGSATCSINGCPERPSCLLKYDAERCATYRAIVLRGLPISR